IERRIEIDESLTRPRVIQAAGRPARVRARPRTWICSRRVEIEVSKRVENPAWCDMILRIADTALVRTNSHDALPVNASAEAKMSMNAVTTVTTDLDGVGRYAAIAPWRECCAADAARIAAHRGECGDDRLDDDHVAIIVLVKKSDATVMPLNFA